MNTFTKSGALAMCVVAVVVVAYTTRIHGVVPMPFEPERWRQDRAVFESDTRERMAADLIRNQALMGLSRSEVLALLGDTEIPDQPPSRALKYEIREDYYGIDPISGSYMVVEFGPQDMVSTVRTEDWKPTN